MLRTGILALLILSAADWLNWRGPHFTFRADVG